MHCLQNLKSPAKHRTRRRLLRLAGDTYDEGLVTEWELIRCAQQTCSTLELWSAVGSEQQLCALERGGGEGQQMDQ
jgi:hypothetical protein